MATGGDELTPFKLEHVEGLEAGEKKGHGAYGTVYKVTVNGVPCIAKRIHDILVNEDIVSLRVKAAAQQKFRQECLILSKLRHPNIVHFIGVHYGRGRNDLSLVMECLHTDLGKCVETHPNIPLSIKLAILLDVSYGLLYLHTILPPNGPIIHRDLSAGNILLSSDMRARIADLGVSKLLNRRAQTAIAHTKAPGTPDYMPPEALKELLKYDSKLDLFSFGHLTLYTVNQEIPDVFEVTRIHAIADIQQGTYEIRRRRIALGKMGEKHCLYDLTTQCLYDNPENRPNTQELNATLKELCAVYPKTAEDLLQALRTQSMPMKDQSREILELQQQLQAQQQSFQETLEANRTRNEKLVATTQILQNDLQAAVGVKVHVQEELEETSAKNRELFSTVQKLQSELEDKTKTTVGVHESLEQKEEEICTLREKLSSLEKARSKAGTHDHAYQKKLREEINKLRPLAERVRSLKQQLKGKIQQNYEQEAENQTLRQELEALKQVNLEAKLSEEYTHIDEIEDYKEVHKFRTSLKEKEDEIRALWKRLSSLEKASSELSKMQLHAKEQSRKVLELKQQLQAVEVDQEEERASTRETLYNLQDDIKRLTGDQQALQRDKQYLQLAMEATEARNEELVAEVRKLQALHEENERLLEEVEALQRTGSDLRKLLMGTPPDLPPKPKKGTDSRSPSVSPMTSSIDPQGRQLDAHITTTPDSNVTPLGEEMQAFLIKEREEIRHQLQQQFQTEKVHQQQALQMQQASPQLPHPAMPKARVFEDSGHFTTGTGRFAAQQSGGIPSVPPYTPAVESSQSTVGLPQGSRLAPPTQGDPDSKYQPASYSQQFQHPADPQATRKNRAESYPQQATPGQMFPIQPQMGYQLQGSVTIPPDHVNLGVRKEMPEPLAPVSDPHLLTAVTLQSSQQPHSGQPFRSDHENTLLKSIQSEIYNEAKHVVSTVREDSSHRVTQKHIPYDPNLVCPYCTKQFRMGEIQYFKRHVGSCTGSDPGTVREDSSDRVTQKHIPYDPNLVCPYCTKQFRMGEIQLFKRHVGSCTGSDPVV